MAVQLCGQNSFGTFMLSMTSIVFEFMYTAIVNPFDCQVSYKGTYCYNNVDMMQICRLIHSYYKTLLFMSHIDLTHLLSVLREFPIVSDNVGHSCCYLLKYQISQG